MICLTSLIRQRISVPELKKEKWQNYLIIIFASLSVLSMIAILYYNELTLEFSE